MQFLIYKKFCAAIMYIENDLLNNQCWQWPISWLYIIYIDIYTDI